MYPFMAYNFDTKYKLKYIYTHRCVYGDQVYGEPNSKSLASIVCSFSLKMSFMFLLYFMGCEMTPAS